MEHVLLITALIIIHRCHPGTVIDSEDAECLLPSTGKYRLCLNSGYPCLKVRKFEVADTMTLCKVCPNSKISC